MRGLRRRAADALARLGSRVPTRWASESLLRALRADPGWVPPGNIEIAFRLDGALRRLPDPSGANRWLHHRWTALARELVHDLDGVVAFRPGFRALCVGAGTRNPLAFPLLVGLTGASAVHALEPEPLGDEWRALWGLQEMALRALTGALEIPRVDTGRDALSRFLDLPALFDGAPLAAALRPALRVHTCTLEALELPDGVDLVTSRSVLEHLADPDGAVAALARLVRPGGVMHHDVDFSSHDANDPLSLYSRDARASQGLDGLNGLRLSDWIERLGAAGFTVDVVRRTRWDGPLDRSSHAARFAAYDEEDLRCRRAVLVARRTG